MGKNPTQGPRPGARPPASSRPAGPAGARKPGAVISRPGTRAPTALQAGAFYASARKAPGRRAQEKYATKQMVMLTVGSVLAVCLVLSIVFAVKAMRGPERPVLGKDAEVRKEMQRVTYQEINKWLSEGHDRVLMGHTPGQTRKFVDDLYKLGPKEVLAGGGRMSMHVIVVLPEDVESRTALFGWYNNWTGKYKPEILKERDVGQQYLMVDMPVAR